MLELENARGRILAALTLLPVENVAVATADGRFLAEAITAPMDLPPFDNSAMDGYAVRTADVAAAAPDRPVPLRVGGQVAAGEVFSGEVKPGACVRLFTGSALPAGSDAVVMQEDTRRPADAPGTVEVLDAVKPWENVRLRGGDVKRGAMLLAAGERITAARLGLLAAAGVGAVSVRRQPVVGLLATGSELLEPGATWTPGHIYESNRAALAALLTRAGAVARVFPLVPDTLAATRAALQHAFTESDAVITSGGVSVGELDFVKAAFEGLGGALEFWKVSIKPGKPFVFGRLGNQWLFGLPGNPVSALVTFLLLVRPALLRMQGAASVELPAQPGTLAEPLANPEGRRHFVRVQVDERGGVRPSGVQASHVLSSLARAHGLVDVPPRTTLAAGAVVSVLRMEDC